MSSVTNLTGPDEAVAAIAAQARQADPGLPAEAAELLAAAAQLHQDVEDAPELARVLLGAFPSAGATAANVVAVAALHVWRGGGP